MVEGFQVARLIPVSGIANDTEAEMRATSALLAVLAAVRDFSAALTTPLGATSARRAVVESFIETRFKLDEGVVRPDGLIQVSFGSAQWRCLIEVKTGTNRLQAEQINSYLAVAREQGINAVLTISNEIASGTDHPCSGVKQPKSNAKVRLAHLSWTEILTAALRLRVHHGVADPEQAWILGELIRYLEHPASGAMAFDDMGTNWVAVRDGARDGSLRRTSEEVRDVADRWDQLIRFAALKLGADIGADVQPVVPRPQQEAKARMAALVDSLTTSGQLEGGLRIPNAAGALSVVADIRARVATVSTDITAPNDRGSKARVSWLLRQLDETAPAGLMVEAWARHSRTPQVATLRQAKEDPALLLDPEKRDTLRFRLVLRAEMGLNRKDGGRTAGFIESVVRLVDSFYRSVLEQVTAWIPAPPKTRLADTGAELVTSPIGDRDELDDAIGAAVQNVADETGPVTMPVEDEDEETPEADMAEMVPAPIAAFPMALALVAPIELTSPEEAATGD